MRSAWLTGTVRRALAKEEVLVGSVGSVFEIVSAVLHTVRRLFAMGEAVSESVRRLFAMGAALGDSVARGLGVARSGCSNGRPMGSVPRTGEEERCTVGLGARATPWATVDRGGVANAVAVLEGAACPVVSSRSKS
jgi:hypothetical protein